MKALKINSEVVMNLYTWDIDQHHWKLFYHFQHLKHIVLPEVPKKISKPQELIYTKTAIKQIEKWM